MTLDQMNGPAHNCIREPQSVAPWRKVASLSFLNTTYGQLLIGYAMWSANLG